ncbi:hypothetical protein QNO09_11480 [Streptomyces sp. 378]|uniref:hypothetical protein n=1 Tax=Streptomyces sp. 378 TaxID=3049412 RepID=UPI0024C46893|nr:hypothetical protein [Streptomyces sp. 378]MDK1343918.1 hypothetical protein [Streptomyces sp. 378]
MVSSEPVITEFMQNASPSQIRTFVASCAERMAQLFTGVVGMDATRSLDVESAIDCLDLLWKPQSQASWGEKVEKLGALPELVGEEEPSGLLAYAYDAAATLYYAAKYRETGSIVDAVSCSNHALNSAEFVSEELADGVDRYEIELGNQRADIASVCGSDDPGDHDLLQFMRERAREQARARLVELTSR